MLGTTPFEKRRDSRESRREHGFLYVEGKPVVILLRDVCKRGVGAYARAQLTRGERGKLSARLPRNEQSASYDTEVRWCGPCADPEHKNYAYRVGLAILPPAAPGGGPSPLKPRPATTLETAAPGPESAHRVKGIMLLDFAKVIRQNHDKPWQNYFDLDDMRVLTEMIIPLAWYPLKIFRKAGLAVFEVLGKKDPESAREWGRGMVRRTPPEIMSSFFLKSDPAKAIRNYVNVNRSTFSFLKPRFTELGEKKIKVGLHGDPGLKKTFPEFELLGLIMAGAIEEIARLNNGSNPTVHVNTQAPDDELIALEAAWT